MAANSLIFKDAELARDAIIDSQRMEIAMLYNDWAGEIGERANYYKRKENSSSWVSEQQMRELQKQLRESSQEVSNEIYSKVKKNMYTVADSVVQCNAKWLSQFGFEEKGINAAFSSVNDSVVRNIVTGQIYDSGWSLSKRIWGDNEQTLKDIYQVVAKGIAENRPMYDIAKNLEAYVKPGAKLPWNLEMNDGVKIFKKQVDYNAQRLGRTLVQHGYQQSFIATTQKNPFILGYIWNSNGSRVCPLCQARDGQHFSKDNLPMDHPNGMCTMVPDVADNIADQLVDWFNSEDGTYPEIDTFAGNFGYDVSNIKTGKTKNISGKSKDKDDVNKVVSKELTDKQKEKYKNVTDMSQTDYRKWAKENKFTAEDLEWAKTHKHGGGIFGAPNMSKYATNYSIDMSDADDKIKYAIDKLVDSDTVPKDKAFYHAFKNDYKDMLFGEDAMLDKSLIGKTFYSGDRYLSTSVDKKHIFMDWTHAESEDVRDYVLKIVAPKGTNAFPTMNFGEAEVLLGRNLEFEVLDVQERAMLVRGKTTKIVNEIGEKIEWKQKVITVLIKNN